MENILNKLFSRKGKSLQNTQNPELLSTLWMNVDNTLNEWICKPLDEEKLLKDLKNMNRSELKICENRLEKMLKDNIVSILFWDNLEQLKWKDFSLNDLEWYRNYYLWDTDFWKDLANKCIFLQNLWDEWLSKKILLSLQYRIQRWKTEVRVNVPFNQQYNRQSNSYKIDIDDIGVKFLWLRWGERIVKLVDFLQKIQNSPDNSGVRKLWIFGNQEK